MFERQFKAEDLFLNWAGFSKDNSTASVAGQLKRRGGFSNWGGFSKTKSRVGTIFELGRIFGGQVKSF